jgi:carboxyl-terminal processing protease
MEAKNKGKIWLPLIMAACIALGLVIGTIVTRNELYSNGGKKFMNLNKLSALISLIDAKYVDSVDLSKISEDLIPKVLAELDPHSVYIPADQRKLTDEQLEASFSGIGVQFSVLEDTIYVISVVRGGPSERAGLLAGDRIISIDGKLFTGKGIDYDKILKTLRGEKGSNVKLGVKRYKNPKTLYFNVVRDDIPVYSIDAKYKIGNEIGYIKIGSFGINAHSEFIEAYAYLQKLGCKRFIIDLRGNTGGLMDPAVNIANEFLPDNRLILYTKGKAYPRENVFSNGSGSCQNCPVVVIVDEWSASSSEILTGALQDNDRAWVVGRRSFGKGLVQTEIPFKDGSAVRLTIARFYIPSGRSIQKPYVNGADPNYQMDLINRYKKGEFDSKDSIRFADSLKFETVGGRTVYGGGGIMPDFFVPLDTSGISVWYSMVQNKNLISGFSFAFVDRNREFLKKFDSPNKLSSWLDDANLIPSFVDYAANKGVRGRPEFISMSFPLVSTQIKASISRLMLGEDAFWKIYQEDDPTLTKAVEVVIKAKSRIKVGEMPE